MRFDGDVYFNFDDVDSWRLFVLLTRAEQEGVDVDVAWIGFEPWWDGMEGPLQGGLRALAMHAAVHDPRRGRTLRAALFTLRHLHGDDFDDDLVLQAAARVAGLDPTVMLDAVDGTGADELRRWRDAAVSAGVSSVPAVVRGGPPLVVATTPAVDEGPATDRLEVIDRMLADDGLWRLAKP